MDSDSDDDEDDEYDEEDDDESDEEERKARSPKKKKAPLTSPKSPAATKATRTPKSPPGTATNVHKFPPDCVNREGKPNHVVCGKPSIFVCKECRSTYCMDCDDHVHMIGEKRKHQRQRVTRENMNPTATTAAASSSATAKSMVKVVMKGTKSLPATSLAGIKEQQAAQHQAEEKQNHATAMARTPHRPLGGGIGRIGVSSSAASSAMVDSSISSIPLNLPKTANILHYIGNDALKQLPANEVQRIFDHYCSASGGEPKDKLRKDDLLRLAGDIIERVKRLLGEEMKKQGMSVSQIPKGIEVEIGTLFRGKDDTERKTNLVMILAQKSGQHKAQVPKSAFFQVWGSLAQELFTVRTDGALGCVIF